MVDTSGVRWTGGLASNMWQVIMRIVVLGFLLIALVTVGNQSVAAQPTGESGGFSGVLWEDLDEDSERDSAEEALAGMIVVLYSIDPPGDDEVDRAVTGLDGRYTFASLPDGRYDVRVEISSGTSAGTVSGAGVEGRWLSELTTEDWDLGLIRHDPSLPPRSDPVPPPQVSVEAITVERPAASAPTSESVPTDSNRSGSPDTPDTSDALDALEVLGKVELNAAEDDLLVQDDAGAAGTTTVAPPPRSDPTTTAAPTSATAAPEVASATTFVPSSAPSDASAAPPVTVARVETTETSPAEPATTTMGAPASTLVPPPKIPPSTTPPDTLDDVALQPIDGVGGSTGRLDDRAMVLVTSTALAMTGIALLTGARRRRHDLRP